MEDALAARRVDRLGVVLVAGGALAATLMPFIIVKANRIAAGKPQLLIQLLAQPAALALLALLVATALAALFMRSQLLRLGIATLTIAFLIVTLGLVSTAATPTGSTVARITPGGAFWVLLAVIGLVISDALVKLRLSPWLRVTSLALYAVLLGLIFKSGLLDNLSIMKEYANNTDKFWNEGLGHVFLALGSVAIAILLALPLGIFCYWQP
ncbi:MAG TPA: ABC transporter permease, partial [Rhizobium sp.]